MMTIAQPCNTVELDDAVQAVTARALAKFPDARRYIERGAELVRADAVTDMRHLEADTFTVRSAVDPSTLYYVTSNGVTTCDCPDFRSHERLCKHGWAVLLVRAIRKEANRPRLRHGYHMASGEEGYCRRLPQHRAEFWPGGHTYSFVCDRDDVCIGPVVQPTGRPW